ncbi:MAG: hypothetical protein HC853_10985 [Anaerolineae bacterium]|nr:hypothetical protein [Anaerolineae bacterium]
MMALPYDLQQAVLRFIQQLKQAVPQGVAGNKLLKFVGLIPQDDLRTMSAAIEEGCERIDGDEW